MDSKLSRLCCWQQAHNCRQDAAGAAGVSTSRTTAAGKSWQQPQPLTWGASGKVLVKHSAARGRGWQEVMSRLLEVGGPGAAAMLVLGALRRWRLPSDRTSSHVPQVPAPSRQLLLLPVGRHPR